MATKTTAPTSVNQAVMLFGFNPTQASAIVAEATRLDQLPTVRDITAKHADMPADMREKVRAWIAEKFLPAPATGLDLASIAAIVGAAGLPPVPQTAPQTAAPAVDKSRKDFRGQAPLSSATGRRLAWVINSNWHENERHPDRSARYINVGDARRAVGMTLADWEELLTTHRDELLREIRKLA